MRPLAHALLIMVLVLGSFQLASVPVAAEDRGYYDPFNEANGDFYLDPDGDIVVDEGTGKCFTPGFASPTVPFYQDYRALLYPNSGFDSFGLDNGHTTTTGWHAIEVSVEAPPVTATGWYKLAIVLRCGATAAHYDLSHQWKLSASGTFGQVDMTEYWSSFIEYGVPFFGMNNGTAGMDRIYPANQEEETWVGWANETPAGNPWRYADVSTGFSIRIDAWYPDIEIWNIWAKFMYAVLTPTIGPDIQAGRQILRPDADLTQDTLNDWWTGTPDPDNYFTNIDEVTLHSDNATSYIYSDYAWDVEFSLTDPGTDLGTDGSFGLILWVIARSSEFYTMNRDLEVGLASGNYPVYKQEATISTSWHNWSFNISHNPATGIPWTWYEILELKVLIGGGQQLDVSQVAVIVIDTNYVPPGETGGEGFLPDLLSGEGIRVMFALLGFFGMIATPALSYMQYKNGDDPLLAGSWGIYLMVLFFGLFVTGVWLAT